MRKRGEREGDTETVHRGTFLLEMIEYREQYQAKRRVQFTHFLGVGGGRKEGMQMTSNLWN